MGRKLALEKQKRGPGKKAKRQQDPVLPKQLDKPSTKPKKLSSHQKKRLKKALLREKEQEAAKKKKVPKTKIPGDKFLQNYSPLFLSHIIVIV